MGADRLLEMQGIGKSFPGVRALDCVDFGLGRGEVHVLLGENGAGKSTLMRILSGAERPDTGEIRIDGERVDLRGPHDAHRLGVNTVYQELSLVPQLSVGANIFLGRELAVGPGVLRRRTMESRAASVLQELGIDLDPAAPVARLNLAQQQMVEIARALAFESRILILDEPTSALTHAEIRALFGLLRKVKQRGVGIVYISHRMQEIFEIGDRVTVLRDGRWVATKAIAGVQLDELIRLMADRELQDHYPRRAGRVGEVLLEVNDLATEGKLRDIGFVLRAGEIVGVAGLLGSGRTTLARVLFGDVPRSSGSIRVRGEAVGPGGPRSAIRRGMAYLTEDRRGQGLVLPLSVEENIALTNTDRVYAHGVLHRERQRQLAETQVRQLRIRVSHLAQAVGHLSGGNQQKVVLGKWLAREPRILIFDEPTRGIDVAAKVDIYELMNVLTEQGVGILMISSELPEVLGMSDRILVMREGRIATELRRGEADQQILLRAALPDGMGSGHGTVGAGASNRGGTDGD